MLFLFQLTCISSNKYYQIKSNQITLLKSVLSHAFSTDEPGDPQIPSCTVILSYVIFLSRTAKGAASPMTQFENLFWGF